MPEKILSPARLFMLMTGAVFTAEFLLMMLLRQYPSLSGLQKGLIDSLMLIFILSPAFYVLFFRPIRRQIEARLMVEAELRKKNQELDLFVEKVAHSLQSTLHPIIGSAWFLHDKYGKTLDGTDAELLSLIEQDGRTLSATIRDLLDLSRMRDKVVPEEAVEVSDVVQEVLHKLPGIHDSEDNAISVRQLPNAYIPRNLLTIALDNLIRNAVSYGKNGDAFVEIYGQRENGAVSLFVRDHGIGVPADERDRIFDIFYRGMRSRHLPGSGVGLALVQKIAFFYGGRVWVEETPGGGATFCLQFRDDRY